MLRYALPEYRLPKSVLRREIELIERLGVKFVFNTRVGIRRPAERTGRSVRCRLPLHRHVEGDRGSICPGTELKGVYPALPFLEVGIAGASTWSWAGGWR